MTHQTYVRTRIEERLRSSLLKGDDPAFYMLRNADIVEAAHEIERLTAALREVIVEAEDNDCLTAAQTARAALEEQ
jgi:hypothetical protein